MSYPAVLPCRAVCILGDACTCAWARRSSKAHIGGRASPIQGPARTERKLYLVFKAMPHMSMQCVHAGVDVEVEKHLKEAEEADREGNDDDKALVERLRQELHADMAAIKMEPASTKQWA